MLQVFQAPVEHTHFTSIQLLDPTFKGLLVFLAHFENLQGPSNVWIFSNLIVCSFFLHMQQVSGNQSHSCLQSYPVFSCTQVFAQAFPAALKVLFSP